VVGVSRHDGHAAGPLEELIQPALDRAKVFFERRLKDPAAAAAAFTRLRMDVKGDGVADSDVVIEAIFENVEAQTSPVRGTRAQAQAERHSGHQYLEHQDRDLVRDPQGSEPSGRHPFLQSVAQLQLVEIVQGTSTQRKSCRNALKFTRKLDKLPLPAKSAPGFVVNRIFDAVRQRSPIRLEGGIPAAVIDRVGKAFGMPMARSN